MNNQIKQYIVAFIFALGSCVSAYSCDCDREQFEPVVGAQDERLTRQIVVDTYATLTCCGECVYRKILPKNLPFEESQMMMKRAIDVFPTDVITDDFFNYSLLENRNANIIITGNNVTLDLNGFTLSGCVIIDGADAIVKNGAINVPDFTTSDPAIVITNNGLDTLILGCNITCDPIVTPSQLGRTVIENSGVDTIIAQCTLLAGDAVDAPGGAGIVNNGGTIVSIENCIIESGDGVPGGVGIQTDDTLIIDCVVETGEGINFTSGDSGVGILGERNVIRGCRVRTGRGGSALAVNAGNAAECINNVDGFVENCELFAGAGGFTFNPVFGGNGGAGVINAQEVRNCVIVAGDGGLSAAQAGNGGGGIINCSRVIDSVISGGAGGPGIPAGSGGIGISITASVSNIENCVITGGNGGVCQAENSSGGNGGDALLIDPLLVVENTGGTIRDCKLIGGAGGGLFLPFANCVGGSGGNGILIDSIPGTSFSNFTMNNLVIYSGNGADAAAGGAGGDGGDGVRLVGTSEILLDHLTIVADDGGAGGIFGGRGGHGIVINGSMADPITNTMIQACTILRAGQGGAPTGNGGHGIVTSDNSFGTQVTQCVIKDTGAGLIPGYAILDQSSTMPRTSKMFGNFSSNIANPTQYIIENEGTVATDNGVPVSPAVSQFDNVYA